MEEEEVAVEADHHEEEVDVLVEEEAEKYRWRLEVLVESKVTAPVRFGFLLQLHF